MFCAHQARERCGALVYELQDGQDQLSTALQEREALRADLAASMDLVQASVAACDGLRCRVDDVNRQQRRDRNQAEAWHADAMELQHKLERCQDTKEAGEQAAAQREAQLQRELDTCRAHLSDAEQRCAAATTAANDIDAECGKRTAEVKSLNDALVVAKDDAEEWRAKAMAHEGMLASQREQTEAAQEQAAAAMNEVSELRGRVDGACALKRGYGVQPWRGYLTFCMCHAAAIKQPLNEKLGRTMNLFAGAWMRSVRQMNAPRFWPQSWRPRSLAGTR